MEEEYELVSKEYIKKLKDEIKELKSKQNKTPQIEQNDSTSSKKILETLNRNTKEQQELLLKELEEIKELNRSTLDNVLGKTQSLDSKLDIMIEHLGELTKEVSHLVDEIPQSHTTELQEKINDLKITLNASPINNGSQATDPQIISKLNEIDMFMKNLRVLLSYVKPNDLSINKSDTNIPKL